MRTSLATFAAPLGFVATFAASSVALAVEVTSDNRYARYNTTVSSFNSTESSSAQQYADSGDWDVDFMLGETGSLNGNSVSVAVSMSSSVVLFENGAVISGSGAAVAEAESVSEDGARFSSQNADATSYQSFNFSIEEDRYFSLQGSLEATFSGSGFPRGGAYFDLGGVGNDFNFSLDYGRSSASNDFEQDMFVSGLLNAGSYSLTISSSADADFFGSSQFGTEASLGSYDFEFILGDTYPVVGPNVGEVPVPAAAWLFGSALLGLVGVSRKRS